MDLTSLLNSSVGTNPGTDRDHHHDHHNHSHRDEQQQPTTKPQASGWAGLPTPSPEKSPPRPSAPDLLPRQPALKSRTPWDAGGYSLPLSLDTKFFPAANVRPVIYGGSPDTVSASSRSYSHSHSHPHSAVTPSSGHSRNTSLESSPADMVSSALVSPMTTSHPFKPAFLGEGNQLEIPTGRRASTISETDAQLTARRPSFLNPQDGLFSPSGSPRSPQHKFSDSHSSLSSSYTPSSRSGSHSRISSFSTVGMVQPLSTLLNEIPSIEEKVERGGEGEGVTNDGGVDNASQFSSPQSQRLPSFGHQRLGSWAPPPPREPAGYEARKRSRSPSDAFLINREVDCESRAPTNNEYIANQDHHYHHHHHNNNNHDQVNALPPSSFLVSHRFRHKRAISAPSFAQQARPPFPHPAFRGFAHQHQPTLPSLPLLSTPFIMSSPAGDNYGQEADKGPGPNNNNTNTNNGQGPDNNGNSANTPSAPTPSSNGSRAKNLHIRCEKVENCTTGTDRRKLISHMFGRNKTCTRGIPEAVWHHYCRKHYQRARYQEGKDYVKTQIGFVLSQIDRIQAWSDGNAASGTGAIVQDWALCIRKREKQRRSKAKNDESGEEDEDEEDAIASGTALPDWLAAKIRPGYSTAEMSNIMRIVRDEIYANNLRQIPDIEILPNLVGGDSQPRRTQRRRSRAQNSQTSSHRRAQSVTIPPPRATAGNPQFLAPMSRRGSQPALRGPDDNLQPLHRAEKRKAEDSLEQSNTPPNARRTALPHRPSISRIQEERSSHAPLQAPNFVTSERGLAPGAYLTPRASPPRHNRSRSDIPRAVPRPSTLQFSGMHSSAPRNDHTGYRPGPRFTSDPFRGEPAQERRFSSFDESQVSRLNHARRVSTSAAGPASSYGNGGSSSLYPEQRPEAGVHLPPPSVGGEGHARHRSGTSLPSLSQITGQAFTSSGPEVGRGISFDEAYLEAYGGPYTGEENERRRQAALREASGYLGYSQGGSGEQGHAYGPHQSAPMPPYHGSQAASQQGSSQKQGSPRQESEQDGGQSSQ